MTKIIYIIISQNFKKPSLYSTFFDFTGNRCGKNNSAGRVEKPAGVWYTGSERAPEPLPGAERREARHEICGNRGGRPRFVLRRGYRDRPAAAAERCRPADGPGGAASDPGRRGPSGAPESGAAVRLGHHPLAGPGQTGRRPGPDGLVSAALPELGAGIPPGGPGPGRPLDGDRLRDFAAAADGRPGQRLVAERARSPLADPAESAPGGAGGGDGAALPADPAGKPGPGPGVDPAADQLSLLSPRRRGQNARRGALYGPYGPLPAGNPVLFPAGSERKEIHKLSLRSWRNQPCP